MTPRQRENLKRLLSPGSIACVGGRDAAFAVGLCVDAGFEGPVWGVNPNRAQLGGVPCFPTVEDLPEPPDAVFLAVPANGVVETITALRNLGAGGAVCFTAGFGETGETGVKLEHELVDAAGDLALVGPNCSGLLNFVDNALLWPFVHGAGPTRRGVALVTQSGMLGNTFTLNQRSLPFSYIISSGNQAMLGIEDYLEVLIEDPAVTGIGLYIERLDDIPRFAEAAVGALRNGIPIVVHKAGSSEIGSKLTITHTGSLSGDDDLYQALFDRLGIVRVHSPVMLLESLKLLTVAGAPTGNRVAAFTCSGGDATMVADEGERLGLVFPQPSAATKTALANQLPDIATVSNPLDYTTPLWGNEEKLPGVLTTMLRDGYDMALMVQDYPAPAAGLSRAEYIADARSFINVTTTAGVPAAVCSCLPENLDQDTRELLITGGVAPLQGIDHAVDALACAAAYGLRRQQILSGDNVISWRIPSALASPAIDTSRVLDEWEGKTLLRAAGIPVPRGEVTTPELAGTTAGKLGYPVVVKMVSEDLPHKTEAGAVKLGVGSVTEVMEAINDITQSVLAHDPSAVSHRFLVESMVAQPIAEMLIGIRQDTLFGLAMVIASGGTLVELIRDSQTLLLPTDHTAVTNALSSLCLSNLLDGYRGGDKVDRDLVIDQVLAVAAFAESHRDKLLELDINPMMITSQGLVAADVLIRLRE